MRECINQTVVRALLLLGMAGSAYAQETTGTIIGTLFDQTGAVLPDVKVVIASTGTGQTREVVTDGAGRYQAVLPVGEYEITFQLTNFQPFTARGISVHLNDRLQVNGKLVVGAVDTLTVTAERLVQPASTVRSLIKSNAVQQLPLLTRTLVQLVTLVPGVSSDLREEVCFCQQGLLSISINGARRSAVNWLLDGASNVNATTNFTLLATPSLETIQEINVVTSGSTAEWARSGGGIVNVVTKSGTTNLAGSVYHFLRNDALNANSFFRNMSPLPERNSTPPRLRYNNFGYTVGGPLWPLPKKVFFFFSEEFRRSGRERINRGNTGPDPAWLIDPNSPNYVPPADRDPNAMRLLSLWPSPNVLGTNSYRTSWTQILNTRQEFVRVDYTGNAFPSITGRYFRDLVEAQGEFATTPELQPGSDNSLGQVGVLEVRNVFGFFSNALSYQVSGRDRARKLGRHTRRELGIAIPELFSENAGDRLPNIAIAGLPAGIQATQPLPMSYLNHTLSDSVTWQRGGHTLKTGLLMSFERQSSNSFDISTQGSFFFGAGGGFTAFQNFVRGNADGSCGVNCNYTEFNTDVVSRFRFRRYEAYAQDTWRIHPRVTLDLGVRYSLYPPITDEQDFLFTFSPEAYNPAQAPSFFDPEADFIDPDSGNLFNGIIVAGKNSPYGRAIYPIDKNNVQPRLGLAWDPQGDGGSIVRAAYGVYFDQFPTSIFNNNVEFSSYTPWEQVSVRSNPALSNPSRGTSVPVLPFGGFTGDVIATSDSLVTPRAQQWNIGLQRRLYSRGVLDIDYVGSRGDHLLRRVGINQPQPADVVAHPGAYNLARPYLGHGSILMRETTGKRRYHGLLASLRHDAGRAGSATLNYTFSRNTADASDDSNPLDTTQNPLNKDAEFATARTDRAHILTGYYIYEVPFFRDAAGGWRKGLLGGWQVSGMTIVDSGPPVRLTASTAAGLMRPNQVGDPRAGEQAGLRWFDPAAFALPAPDQFGNAPVAPFRLPGRHQWDISVAKNFQLGRTRRLELRTDFINAFNSTQFLDVDTFCVGTTTCDPRSPFGQVTSTRAPREVQLGVRVNW